MATFKTSLFIALVLCSAFCYWTVPLKLQEITKEKEEHPHDWIYTADVAYGEEEKKLHALFDSTTPDNYIITSVCSSCPHPKDHNLFTCDTSCVKASEEKTASFSTQGNRVHLENSELFNEKCIIAGEHYKDINF